MVSPAKVRFAQPTEEIHADTRRRSGPESTGPRLTGGCPIRGTQPAVRPKGRGSHPSGGVLTHVAQGVGTAVWAWAGEGETSPGMCWRICPWKATPSAATAAARITYLRSCRVRGLQPQIGQDSVSAAIVFLHPGHFRRAIGTSACVNQVDERLSWSGILLDSCSQRLVPRTGRPTVSGPTLTPTSDRRQ